MPIPTVAASDAPLPSWRSTTDEVPLQSDPADLPTHEQPFERALAQARSTPVQAGFGPAAASTQRPRALGAFEQESGRARDVTAQCERELQQAMDHSQASAAATRQLASADHAQAPQQQPVEESTRQERTGNSTSSRQGQSSAAASSQGPESNRAAPPHTAGNALPASGAPHTNEPATSLPTARDVRAVSGTVQSAASAACGARVTENAGASTGAAASSLGQAASGKVQAGTGGGVGDGDRNGVAVAGKAQPVQGKSRPFAGLMQSARPQAPEATLVVRTSKALAQALRTGGDLKLDLSPEQLGRIQVRMNSTEQGMAVVLACQEPHAAQTLERSLPELQRSLEAQGVHATSVRVCLMDGAVDVNPAGTQLPDAQDRGASTTAQGESGTKGRHESTRRGADSAAPAGREDEGELWEVDSRLGTVIASVPVAGITRAVDMTA